MKWTTAKPTKPGWYWVNEFGTTGSVKFVVRLDDQGDLFWGLAKLFPPTNKAKWAGPIPEPE